MHPKIYYSDRTELHLGDYVKFRVLIFFPAKGQVVYVPFTSKKHHEMEIQGLHFVGIKLVDGSMSKSTVDPKNNTAVGLNFIKRGRIDTDQEVHPEDQLFEDENGNPL